MDPMTIANAAFSLFIILNPFASLPIFMSIAKGLDERTVRSYADKASLVAAVLLIALILIGPPFMGILGIGMKSFRIAGGIVLILMAIMLVFDIGSFQQNGKGTPWIIVATPLLAGPGVITQGILLSSEKGMLVAVLASIVAMFLIWAMLRGTSVIVRVVGDQAMTVLSKVIGLFVAAIGVEYIIRGLLEWFPGIV